MIDRFRGRRLLVTGDFMLDRFVWGKATRISPEAPVPVVEIERETEELGGAGNVVHNLLALGAAPQPIGLVGKDAWGERLIERLRQSGVDTRWMLRDASRPTTTKTRIMAHQQQLVRADQECRKLAATSIVEALLDAARRVLTEVEGVIISDYDKGTLTPEYLRYLLEWARNKSLPVFIDPKIRNFRHYQPVTLIKPNHREAERVSQVEIHDTDSLHRAAAVILGMIDCEYLLVTRGEDGMSLFSREAPPEHVPAGTREVYDVTGAGDTVMATVGLACVSGGSPLEAAILANGAAGVVIAKLGTATLTSEELKKAFQD
ncbi:MAG: D-glycero-beta-D-manno-heptose-7-phosphate kinase [Acidobacteria bacterium]|nr:D-glycero-beta-D-manno-heptose-7-phosphate kinase [Acidobacteriota bacterium]